MIIKPSQQGAPQKNKSKKGIVLFHQYAGLDILSKSK